MPVISDVSSIDGYLVQEATGDFNGDGNVDIATLSYLQLFGPLTLTVLHGQGDGTFQADASISLNDVYTYASFDLEVGRINGDGYDDLVMLDGSFQMKVYFGSAGGLSSSNTGVTDLTQTITPGVPIQSGEVVLGHFSQADRLDAAILPSFGNVMRLLVNQGDGTFAEQLFPLSSVSQQTVDFNVNAQTFDEGDQVLVEDLDHDGIDDTLFAFGKLGTSPNEHSGVLTIRKTGGADGFVVSAVAANSLGQDLKGGDLNGDGLLDIAINSLEGTGGLKLLQGLPDGTFQAFASSPFIDGNVDTAISSMAFGNVVGTSSTDLIFNPTDGILDENNGQAAYVFGVAAGQGNGAFGTPVIINRHQNGSNESLITEAGRVLIADVNHDGAPDLINIYRNFNFGQHPRVSVLLNTGGTHTSLEFPDLEEGSPITIVATVGKNSADVSESPGGSVTFFEGSTILGQAPLIEGVATSDLLFLDAGQHTIYAVYSGDENFLSSVAASTQINVIVNPGRTKTSVTFPNLMEGDTLAQADVTKYFASTAGIPEGTVTFKEGNQIVGEGALVGGQLVAPLDLPAGSHTIYAVYTGDGTFTPSTSKNFTIYVQPAPLPDLGLLHVEADGSGLQFNRETHHFEANGVIHIGLNVDPFQSLLDLSGSISIGTDSIVGNGTVTAHIGSYSAVLFDGNFQFNIGNAHTEEFSAPALPASLKIAGLDIDFKQMELVNGGLNLTGLIHLPGMLGNSLGINASIHVDSNGISSHFVGGLVGFPNVNFVLGGLGISASDLSVDYDSDHDRLKIQGKLGLPDLFGGFISGTQVDLAGNNFIQIQNGEVDIAGELTIKRIDIVPNTWTLKDLKLQFNTLTNTFEGSGKLVFPGGFQVAVDVALVNGQLDTIEVGVGGLNIAVPFVPGAFLKSIGGGVTGLTTAHPTFVGDATFTYLPHVEFDLPAILGGTHFDISLVSLDVQAEINNQHLTATGSVELLKGVSGTGQNASPASVDFNWLTQSIEFSTGMHLINNIINLDMDFTGNSKGNVTFKADATISTPDIDTGILGIHIKPAVFAGAHIEFHFTNNNNYADDYVSLYGRVDLGGFLGVRQIGVRLHFNGTVDFIGLKDPVGQTFTIPADSSMYLLTAAWENDVGDVPIEITDPNGITYTEADFDNINIGLVDQLSGATSKSIGLLNPIPGNWTITIPNETGLGQIAMHGFFEVPPPTIDVTSAISGTNNVTINYDAQSEEPTATVAWYYDTDDSDFNGVLIAENQNALGTAQTFVWDTTGIPAGTYYIYGRVDDGINPSEFAYAPMSVTIANQAPVVAEIDDQTLNEGETLTLTATAVDPNGDIVTFSLGEGAPAGMDIDPATGEITWTPTEAQGPAVYTITVLASDSAATALSGSQTFQVTVGEVNSAPVVRRILAQSRPLGGTFNFTVIADDADLPAQTLQYSLDAGAPAGAAIDPTTGVFTWPVDLQQTPGVYTITIRATDNGTGNLSGTATVDLTVRDAVFTSPGTFQFSAADYDVDEGGSTTITVTRTGGSDGAVALQYALTGNTATSGTDFEATSGFLLFEDGEVSKTFSVNALFDIETEGSETATLTLSNLTAGNLGAQQTAVLTIADVVSVPPVITSSATFSVAENVTAVGTITATDSDIPAQTVTFSITGGADAARFAITSNGALSFAVAPDFEQPGDSDQDNVYQVEVTADDGHGGLTSQTITITVTAVNDNSPVFTTSSTFETEENTTAIGNLLATDADTPAQTVTFTITGGADQALFALTSDGVLSFLNGPDFELPADNGGNNVYDIQVTASDGQGRTTVQNISITVTGVNDNSPTFTSNASFQVAENVATVGTMTATDADLPAQTITYSITGGADQALFMITSNGALSFTSAPDFETPADDDLNNVYEVQVTADDGHGGVTSRLIMITVTDISEGTGSPVLTLGGPAVTWIKKQPPQVIVPDLTVSGGADLNGGTLTLSIDAVGSAKKLLDMFKFPSTSPIGTSSQPQLVNGHLTLVIQLNANATDATIQAFLRGIAFSTKGKGLKITPRTATITLTDNASHSSTVSQTIHILKKAPR